MVSQNAEYFIPQKTVILFIQTSTLLELKPTFEVNKHLNLNGIQFSKIGNKTWDKGEIVPD